MGMIGGWVGMGAGLETRANMATGAATAADSVGFAFSILELLEAHTDPEHGMSAAEISRRLAISEKTVRSHLHTLQDMHPLGRTVGRLTRREALDAGVADATAGWYVVPLLDPAQMRLLADGAILSRAEGEYLQDTMNVIRRLAGHAGEGGKTRTPSTPRGYNREFLSNVETLDEAIRIERPIRFHYCTYDVHGRLVPRTDDDGTVREYAADPYRLMYRNGRYYLICHMHQYTDLSYLHVERIRHLTVERRRRLKRTLQSMNPDPSHPFDLDRHMRERPYPVKGPATRIRMRVTDLEPVYDWFEDAHVRPLDGGAYEAIVIAAERAVLWWALQYADMNAISILEPESLRLRLRETGRTLACEYARTAAGNGSTMPV